MIAFASVSCIVRREFVKYRVQTEGIKNKFETIYVGMAQAATVIVVCLTQASRTVRSH